MTQVNRYYTLIHDVFHQIAVNPQSCLQSIVEAARALMTAEGVACVLWEEPQLAMVSGVDSNTLPPDELLQTFCASLSESLAVNPPLPEGVSWPYGGWVIGRIMAGKSCAGVMCLFFDQRPAIDDERQAVLDALLDGMTIATTHLRAEARYERLGRNQSEFMRIVSHDLRSPLTAMQGFADMLESNAVGELGQMQLYYVQKILSGISQINALVDNIQDAGRYDPETGFYEMSRSQCDLTEIASRVVQNSLVPAKKKLTIRTSIADDIPIINADKNMIERAMTNLVDNAIKYTPDGCEVEVGVRRDGEMLLIFVRDAGLGISPENQKKLFKRHVRIPRKEHRHVKGTGLGLFIVRSVALRHGGDAWVKSEEGVGSTFYIGIPLNDANAIIGSA